MSTTVQAPVTETQKQQAAAEALRKADADRLAVELRNAFRL